MDEILRGLFGEESISYDTFAQKLNGAGIKLADISKGDYISKGKFDKLQKDFDTYKKENDVSKYADYEQLKTENETLKAEKKDTEMLNAIATKGVSEKFRKFVLSEVKSQVTEDKKFDEVLDAYLKDNGHFMEKSNPFFTRGSSSADVGGQSKGKPEETNQKINDFIRGK